jgi:hypothetical protein
MWYVRTAVSIIAGLIFSCTQNPLSIDYSSGEITPQQHALAKTTGTTVTQFKVVSYDKNKGTLYIQAFHDDRKKPHGHIYLYQIYGKTSESDAQKMAKNYDHYGPQKQKTSDGKYIKQLKNLHIYMGVTDTKAKVTCLAYYERWSDEKSSYQCVNSTEIEKNMKKIFKKIFSSVVIERMVIAASAWRFRVIYIIPTDIINFFSQAKNESL